MEIEKTEQEIEDFLSNNLEIIEPGLRLIRRQYKTKYGVLDLLCLDKEGNKVAIEVKKEANTNSPGQLSKYVFALKKEFPGTFVRGILVSPSISTEIGELCNHFFLDFKELYDIEEVMPVIRFPKPKKLTMNKFRLLKKQRLIKELLDKNF